MRSILIATMSLTIALCMGCTSADPSPNAGSEWNGPAPETSDTMAGGEATPGDISSADAPSAGGASLPSEGNPSDLTADTDAEPSEPEAVDPAAFQAEYGFPTSMLMEAQTLRSLLTEVDPNTMAVPLTSTIVGTQMVLDPAYQLIDIRVSAFYAGGFIPGSVNIPGGKQFELRLREVALDRKIILVSGYGYQQVAGVIATLQDADVPQANIFVLQDGVTGWVDAGYSLLIDKGRRC